MLLKKKTKLLLDLRALLCVLCECGAQVNGHLLKATTIILISFRLKVSRKNREVGGEQSTDGRSAICHGHCHDPALASSEELNLQNGFTCGHPCSWAAGESHHGTRYVRMRILLCGVFWFDPQRTQWSRTLGLR